MFRKKEGTNAIILKRPMQLPSEVLIWLAVADERGLQHRERVGFIDRTRATYQILCENRGHPETH